MPTHPTPTHPHPELAHILDQIHRSFHGSAWHGPSVLESISGVDAALAARKPIKDAHSIADVVSHLEFTQRVVLERTNGQSTLPIDGGSWPPVEVPLIDIAWPQLIERLKAGAAALERAIAAFPPEKLDQPLVQGGSPAFNNFLGHAQHNAYHAGQIMLLRKAASTA